MVFFVLKFCVAAIATIIPSFLFFNKRLQDDVISVEECSRNFLLLTTVLSLGISFIPGKETITTGVVVEKQSAGEIQAITLRVPDGSKEVVSRISTKEYFRTDLQEKVKVTRRTDFTGLLKAIPVIDRISTEKQENN